MVLWAKLMVCSSKEKPTPKHCYDNDYGLIILRSERHSAQVLILLNPVEHDLIRGVISCFVNYNYFSVSWQTHSCSNCILICTSKNSTSFDGTVLQTPFNWYVTSTSQSWRNSSLSLWQVTFSVHIPQAFTNDWLTKFVLD